MLPLPELRTNRRGRSTAAFTRVERAGRGRYTRRSLTHRAGAAPATGHTRLHFLDRRILLITGKGGVGRTTVTIALARAAARRGKRVLLTEVGDVDGEPSPLGRIIGRPTLGAEPIPLAPGLDACHLSARAGHEGFLRSVLPGAPLIKAALRSRAVERFLIAAPSFHEMGIFYHLLSLLRATRPDGRRRHELIVVDMPATGHTLALTGLPDILLRLIPGGPIVDALHEGRAILNDPRQGAAWVVTLPEQLPVTEAIELLAGLDETSMPTGGVLLNRMPQDPFTPAERAALDPWIAGRELLGELAFRRIEAAEAALGRLRGAVDEPVLLLPEIPGDDPIDGLAAAFDAHLGPAVKR